VIDANQAARALIDGEAPIGRPLASWPRLGAALEQHRASGRTSRVIELAEPRAFYVVQQRPLGAPERPIGTLVQLHDVTERELAHHDAVRALAAREVELDRATALQSLLREQAMRDPLTALLNRRALHERYAQEERLGPHRSLVLALLDVDHFKRINDNHGHAVGDAVLRDLAAALRSGLRAGDALFRIGGEEFALLLPETTTATALERVEALRELVASWRLGGLNETVTFSAGLAESQVSRCSLEALLAAADKALYRAKQSGRDRVEAALAAD
jgi:diguanylate cyclase (GGDEF)-like protein